MPSSSHSAQALQSWSTTYDACYQLYDDDKLEECINVAERHLEDDSMPLYHRMLFELLGGSLGDWYEADDAIRRCEATWHTTHNYNQKDTDEFIRDSLAEIHQLLDGMQQEHVMKPQAMEDPRLAEYEEGGEEGGEEGEEDEDDDDMGVVQEYEVGVDWTDEEIKEEKARQELEFWRNIVSRLEGQAQLRAHTAGDRDAVRFQCQARGRSHTI
jgi:hypothetical protein